eukprot:4857090-Lingulodinium_polyedra.AAC.1
MKAQTKTLLRPSRSAENRVGGETITVQRPARQRGMGPPPGVALTENAHPLNPHPRGVANEAEARWGPRPKPTTARASSMGR